MDRGAKAAQIQIPPQILLAHAQLQHTVLQHLVALLPLAGAHQLPNAGNQQVCGGHGLSVVVQTHVEGLDILGIVGDKHRPAEMLLRQEPLVLGLDVLTPSGLVLKLAVVLLQNLHRVGVGDPGKVRGGHVAQAVQKALIHKLVAELHVLGAGLQHVIDDGLHRRLDDVHVVVEVGKGDFRLDVPELRGVPGGVGALRPEGGPKGVHLGEGLGHGLHLELAGAGQEHLLLEEVLAVVHGAVLCLGEVFQVHGGHLEHLGALAVGGGDNRGMDIHKAVLLEELVDAVGRGGADAEGGAEQVGARPQVGNGPQKLHGVALFLQGVIGGGGALYHDFGSVDFKGLLGLWGGKQCACNPQGGPHVLGGYLLEVINLPVLKHNLDALKGRAVVEVDKAQCFGIPDRPGPAANGDSLSRIGGKVLVKRCHFLSFHVLAQPRGLFPPFLNPCSDRFNDTPAGAPLARGK